MAGLRSYCTLDQLRKRQGLSATDVSDNARLLEKLRAASTEIERRTGGCIFQPVQETRQFDWESVYYLSFRNFDLLSLTALSDSYGTKNTAAIILLGGTQSAYNAIGPFYGVELNAVQDFFLWQTTKMRALTVQGVWGWHDDYANAWIDTTLTVQGGGINAIVTTITPSADPTTTADAWGQSPGISAGALIQVDSEWMQVVATATTPSLTVVRGQNGTTAAVHSASASIKVYQPPKDIVDATARWAAWLFAQDSTDFGKAVIVQMGQTIVPAGEPPDLNRVLSPYVKRRVS